ncbi:MAG: hypothetical protein FWC32_04520 [Firmicutes bacterium]|nr:hypothetical protein [Bacillota bacterium]
MLEQHDLTHLHVQRKLRPKVEDVIPLIVDKDNQQNALDFVAWLRENKMSPGWGGIHNTWNVNYKGKVLCKVVLVTKGFGIPTENQWTCFLYLANIEKYEDVILAENLQDFVWDNLVFCVCAPNMGRSQKIKHLASMGGTCNEARCAVTVTVCGKVFEYKCGNGTFRCYWFVNSNEAEMAAIKRLIQLERQARYEIDKQTL